MSKIWANSGDSHLVEPADLFTSSLPASLAARMPRSEKDADGQWETVHVDGQAIRRKMPRGTLTDADGRTVDDRAPGANDMKLRFVDLDAEGIWAELVYPSIGIWMSSIQDPDLLAAGCRAINDWAFEYQRFSPRYVCTATIPLLSVDTAVAEIHRVADMGFKAAYLSVAPPLGVDDWHYDLWEPMWSALAETGLVIAFHIGTEPHDATTSHGAYFRGPGGALINYTETTYGGQRAVTKMIASGVFDRHPSLKAIVSEGGATWGPFVADRLDEAYRQHGSAVRPKLGRLPSEYLYENVYASFQHDRSAVAAVSAMGWQNVLWGSDYPHLEGTFGHTQETLHGLFDGVAPEVRKRVTVGAFAELFPHVPPAPADEA
ncbi:MAG: amidohydrolase family protein [Actinomycetota bacterium]|nr:amidohydrolase family protein [Actinomycetota bacterium]